MTSSVFSHPVSLGLRQTLQSRVKQQLCCSFRVLSWNILAFVIVHCPHSDTCHMLAKVHSVPRCRSVTEEAGVQPIIPLSGDGACPALGQCGNLPLDLKIYRIYSILSPLWFVCVMCCVCAGILPVPCRQNVFDHVHDAFDSLDTLRLTFVLNIQKDPFRTFSPK